MEVVFSLKVDKRNNVVLTTEMDKCRDSIFDDVLHNFLKQAVANGVTVEKKKTKDNCYTNTYKFTANK